MKDMVPDDLHNVILSSAHTGRFSIVDMRKLKFFDIQTAADSILNLKNVNISKATHIKVDKNHPGILFTKESYSELASWKENSILKRGKTLSGLKKTAISQLPDINKI